LPSTKNQTMEIRIGSLWTETPHLYKLKILRAIAQSVVKKQEIFPTNQVIFIILLYIIIDFVVLRGLYQKTKLKTDP